MTLTVQDYLRECPVPNDLRDDDWDFIMFEFCMNFSHRQIKDNYHEYKKQRASAVTADDLRMLGYSEEDIARGMS